MKCTAAAVPLFLLGLAAANSVSPVEKVVTLLTTLEGKITEEGQEAEKVHAEYTTWCTERSRNVAYHIKTAESEVAELKATLEESAASIDALSSKIEDTAASISSDEGDLKAATGIREKEESDFSVEEKELVEVVGLLERAISILEQEARKGGSSMIQLQRAGTLADALKVMVEASMFQAEDATRLTTLLQRSKDAEEDDSDDSFGAPDPSTYENHSGSIIETLEDLLDKAREQLAESRKKEMTAKHNFEMLKQTLTDQVKYAEEDMQNAKKNLAASQEKKSNAEGELAATSKTLEEDKKTAATLEQDCAMEKRDYEAASASRADELKALAEAKQYIMEKAQGAADITYSAPSFLQITGTNLKSGADLANFEAVRLVRSLAEKEHSEALAQLARRMASAMQYSSATGADPFAKVKDMIRDMIERLEKDASADASHKAYCDKELGETLAKKSEKDAEAEKLQTQIDVMSAKSAELKEEVAALQASLSKLAQTQGEMDKLRNEEHALFVKNKPEMESGIEGVKMALKILREYYAEDQAHEKAEGDASGIVGLLEVVESDFSKTLAEMTATEMAAKAAYDQESKQNAILKTTQEQDVKYKTKEYKQLDSAKAEATSDLEGVKSELAAIIDYNGHLLKMCEEKPETYADRKARFEAEITGLKQALSILEGEAVLLQRRAKLHSRGLRGHLSVDA
mmetsp:Transcript_63394/g.151308  ORF Transcript_63394/g.151308 Transcript_63394/m.151308 type:complete len:690 (+) Transcript_63394:78-2147(+)